MRRMCPANHWHWCHAAECADGCIIRARVAEVEMPRPIRDLKIERQFTRLNMKEGE